MENASKIFVLHNCGTVKTIFSMIAVPVKRRVPLAHTCFRRLTVLFGRRQRTVSAAFLECVKFKPLNDKRINDDRFRKLEFDFFLVLFIPLPLFQLPYFRFTRPANLSAEIFFSFTYPRFYLMNACVGVCGVCVY